MAIRDLLVLSSIGALLFCTHAKAVSLIANIPNAEVTEQNTFIIAHESQFSGTNSLKPWNALSFLTFGLGEHVELASSLYNVGSPATGRIAVSLGFKAVYEIPSPIDALRELKIIGGSEIPFSVQGSDGVGVWIFSGISFRTLFTSTRFTIGPSYGTKQIFGETALAAMVGVEQPIVPKLSLISDWFSGNHALSSLIVALQYDPTHTFTIITGPKFTNDSSVSSDAWMVELTLKL